MKTDFLVSKNFSSNFMIRKNASSITIPIMFSFDDDIINIKNDVIKLSDLPEDTCVKLVVGGNELIDDKLTLREYMIDENNYRNYDFRVTVV